MTESEEMYVAALLQQIDVLKKTVEFYKTYPANKPEEANNE